MRTTVNLDDELLSEAERVSGIKERATLVNEGIKALIERESARARGVLRVLVGSNPDLSRYVAGNLNQHDFGRHFCMG